MIQAGLRYQVLLPVKQLLLLRGLFLLRGCLRLALRLHVHCPLHNFRLREQKNRSDNCYATPNQEILVVYYRPVRLQN